MDNDAWQKWMFRCAFIFTFLAPSIAAIAGAVPGVITTFATVGIAGMILTRLSDFVSFEGFGLKAQLQNKIAEANATIQQLQELALAVAEPVITNLAIQGYPGQIKLLDKYNMRESVNKILLDIGVKKDDIRGVNSTFEQMFRGILIRKMLRDVTSEEEHHSGQAEKLRRVTNVPSFRQIEFYLREFNLLTGERNGYLEELEHLENSGVLRNPTILDE